MGKFVACVVVALSFLAGCKHGFRHTDTRPGPIVRLTFADSGRFFCSGVVIGPNVIATAAHCIPKDPMAQMMQALGFEAPDMPTNIMVTDADGLVRVEARIARHEARSDQALLIGDFSAFQSMPATVNPREIIGSLKHKLVACGYPYAGKLYCTPFVYIQNEDFQLAGSGWLWPRMSGGPVIDTETGKVIGVNTAVEHDKILISPLVEVFSNLGLLEYGKTN